MSLAMAEGYAKSFSDMYNVKASAHLDFASDTIVLRTTDYNTAKLYSAEVKVDRFMLGLDKDPSRTYVAALELMGKQVERWRDKEGLDRMTGTKKCEVEGMWPEWSPAPISYNPTPTKVRRNSKKDTEDRTRLKDYGRY